MRFLTVSLFIFLLGISNIGYANKKIPKDEGKLVYDIANVLQPN